MAGKLHTDYTKSLNSTAAAVAPQGRLSRAYAEGYNAQRKDMAGTPVNPFPASQAPAFAAWAQGAADALAIKPPTHVGGPLPVAPPPP